jgi:hypothetical protein
MKICTQLVLIFCLWMTVACDDKAATTTGTETVTDTNVELPVVEEEATTVSDEPEEGMMIIPTFSVKFDFSPEVKELLAGEEEMAIDITIAGDAASAEELEGKSFFNEEDYKVYLIQKEVIYDEDDLIVEFEGLQASKEAYEALEDKNYEVAVQVYTNRKTAKTNLINSELLLISADQLEGSTHVIKVTKL